MLRSTSSRNTAERHAKRFADSPTSFGRSALGSPRLVMSVREGRLGDFGLLELGHDLLAEPFQLLETDRFRNADREADRYMVEARVAPFEALQVFDDLLGRPAQHTAIGDCVFDPRQFGVRRALGVTHDLDLLVAQRAY